MNQTLSGATHHDTWQIVIAENCLLLQRTGAQNCLFGTHLIKALAPNNGQPVIGKPSIADRIGHAGDIAVGFNFLYQLFS